MKRFVLALIITVIGFASFAETLVKAELWDKEGYFVVTDKEELIKLDANKDEIRDYLYDTESVLTDKHAYWIDKYNVDGDIVYLTYFRW